MAECEIEKEDRVKVGREGKTRKRRDACEKMKGRDMMTSNKVECIRGRDGELGAQGNVTLIIRDHLFIAEINCLAVCHGKLAHTMHF